METISESLFILSRFPPLLPLNVPHGADVARLGLELLRKGEHSRPGKFYPLYIRPSEAEMKFHPSKARQTFLTLSKTSLWKAYRKNDKSTHLLPTPSFFGNQREKNTSKGLTDLRIAPPRRTWACPWRGFIGQYLLSWAMGFQGR